METPKKLFCVVRKGSICEGCPLVEAEPGLLVVETGDAIMITNGEKNRFYERGKTKDNDGVYGAFIKCAGPAEQKRRIPFLPSKKVCGALIELGLQR